SGAHRDVPSFPTRRSSDLMTMRYYMPNEQYATPESKVRRTEDILRRVEALPGVQAAFASNMIPLSGGGGFSQIAIDGRPSEKGRSEEHTSELQSQSNLVCR